MWQDKNKEHPVFDNDPPTRFCTDYPIIILRSSLSLSLCVGPTRIWSTILSFDMCSRFLSLLILILFLLLRLVSLCCMKNCCAWNSTQKWATLKDALIQATCPALPCPRPVPLPALHRNFVAALKSMQQIYAVRSSRALQGNSIPLSIFHEILKICIFWGCLKVHNVPLPLLCSRQFVNMINLCHSKMLRTLETLASKLNAVHKLIIIQFPLSLSLSPSLSWRAL